MINFRYLSFLIYLAGLSLIPTKIGWARESTASLTKIEVTEAMVVESAIDKRGKQFNSHQLNGLVAQADSHQPQQFNRTWSVAGMVATSLLFVYLLMVLFKSDKSSLKAQPVKGLVADSSEEVNSELMVKSEEEIAIKELVIEPTFPMIGMDFSEELIYEPIVNQKSVSPEFTITESLSEKYWQDNQTVDANALGKLTIVTKKITEIDVVFELIQDLQLSDPVENVAAQKDLRRKAIWELGQSNDFRAVEPLIQIIPQVDSLEKSLILDAITQIASRSTKTIHETLLISLTEENPELRNNAIRDLTRLYQSRSSVSVNLSRMSENSNREIEQIARWALEQFNQEYLPAASAEPNIKR